jgi:hypothetical protein
LVNWRGKVAGWRWAAGWLLLVLVVGTACSRPPTPSGETLPKTTVAPVRITQFYADSTSVARGQRVLLCYGVENAKTVRLDPPGQELSAALARCVEATPSADTTYTLTAEGEDGKTATQKLTIPVGPPRAKIVNVTVSSLEVKPDGLVNICYTVENATSVTIEPLHFTGGARLKACVNDMPRQSTTYVISAIGAGGDKDQERVTVKVK